MIFYHDIDPIALSFFGFPIRWYGIGYVISFIFAKYYLIHYQRVLNRKQIDNILDKGVIAVMVGGRLGHVLCYEPFKYFLNPLDIIKVWIGGMSFHGGCVGVILYLIYWSRRNRYDPWRVFDAVSISIPIGLLIGRFTNFINSELCGVATNQQWGVVFEYVDPIIRHPTQLYESCLEGLCLGVLLRYVYKKYDYRPGITSSVFLIGYGLFRLMIEPLKIPEDIAWMPYILCVLMIVIGGIIFFKKNSS